MAASVAAVNDGAPSSAPCWQLGTYNFGGTGRDECGGAGWGVRWRGDAGRPGSSIGTRLSHWCAGATRRSCPSGDAGGACGIRSCLGWTATCAARRDSCCHWFRILRSPRPTSSSICFCIGGLCRPQSTRSVVDAASGVSRAARHPGGQYPSGT